MRNKFFALIMCIAVFLSCTVIYGEECSKELVLELVPSKNFVSKAEIFDVDFNITKNSGFNNFTFFVDYDPNEVKFIKSENTAENVLTVGNTPIITNNAVNIQSEVVPSPNDPDYSGLGADGTKTAGELGRIKLSSRIYNNGILAETNATGKLLTMRFEASSSIGTRTTIKITPVNSGFSPIPKVGKYELSTEYVFAEIDIAGQTTYSKDNVVYIVDNATGTIISAETSEEYIDVPSVISKTTITNIGENAFQKCTSAKEIILPNGVNTIGNNAFSSCNALEKITVPKTLDSIGDYAFGNCKKLVSITLPYGVSLGIGTFSNCSSLETVNFTE